MIHAVFKPFPYDRGTIQCAEAGDPDLSAVGMPRQHHAIVLCQTQRQKSEGVRVVEENTMERGIWQFLRENRGPLFEIISPVKPDPVKQDPFVLQKMEPDFLIGLVPEITVQPFPAQIPVARDGDLLHFAGEITEQFQCFRDHARICGQIAAEYKIIRLALSHRIIKHLPDPVETGPMPECGQ